MSNTRVRVDLSGWEDLHRQLLGAAEELQAEFSSILGELAQGARGEIFNVYATEAYDEIGDKRPTQYTNNWFRTLRIARGGSRIVPWITIYSTSPYAKVIESGGMPPGASVGINSRGNQRGSTRRRGGTTYRRYTGDFADAIYEWAESKMGSKNKKFAENTIKKILNEGIQGRRVMHRALSKENPRFARYMQITIQNRLDALYSRMLAKR